MIASLHVFESW